MKRARSSFPSSLLSWVTESSFHGSIPPVINVVRVNSSTLSLVLCFGGGGITVDVEDPGSVWPVGSIVGVGKGNLSGQGRPGNAEDRGTHFGLELQGHHSRERTGGFLTGLDWKHTTSVKPDKECVTECVSAQLLIVQKPNSVQVW